MYWPYIPVLIWFAGLSNILLAGRQVARNVDVNVRPAASYCRLRCIYALVCAAEIADLAHLTREIDDKCFIFLSVSKLEAMALKR